MNSLEAYIKERGLDAVTVMNRLQDAGVISDNAVLPADVAGADCFSACQWLEADGARRREVSRRGGMGKAENRG